MTKNESTIKRRKTTSVKVGNLFIGSRYPIAVQAMTNTPTSDVQATIKQAIELFKAGADLVRITVNDSGAALAIAPIVKHLRRRGYLNPIIGDFHYNGHKLLSQYPTMAKNLDKYRFNPGNIGRGKIKDENFTCIIKTAIEYNKPVRIGVNWGSLDPDLAQKIVKTNTKNARHLNRVINKAMVESALKSADFAIKCGLKKDRIILSAKLSTFTNTCEVNRMLARKCDYPLHLGVTEAGMAEDGVTANVSAFAVLLEEGIGDTIRASITPSPKMSRSYEVKVCRSLLQSMGLRFFEPRVISCPGCGRTQSKYFMQLACEVRQFIHANIHKWQKKCPGVENLTVAVMGCVVNGPGESKHADIGISLPGLHEKPTALIFWDGQKRTTLTGNNLRNKFCSLIENYIANRYK